MTLRRDMVMVFSPSPLLFSVPLCYPVPSLLFVCCAPRGAGGLAGEGREEKVRLIGEGLAGVRLAAEGPEAAAVVDEALLGA